jgi:hypothetical protein
MKLYKHKTSRDTAIELCPFREGRRRVAVYNINWHKITGERPAFLGMILITVQPREEYEALEYE